jgi:signal transduction histidine kinase
MLAYLEATRDAIGHDAVEELLRPYGITSKQLEDPNAWVSVEFAEAFLGAMVARVPDPNHLRRATELGMTQKYLGALLPLLSLFGTPLFMYQQEAKAATRFNKKNKLVFDGGHPGFARVTFHNVDPFEVYLCQVREIQQSLIPTLFGRPPGIIEHPRCAMRGDGACTYEITWREPPARRDSVVGLFGGAAIGLAAASSFALSVGPMMVAAATFGIAGWALGRLRMVRGDLAERVDEIKEHNDALTKMMRANEQRFAEVVEAKAEVEQKVEQRTHELRLTTQQLSETLTQVQELDRAKTSFFSNVSHDLRTPLTLILGPLGEMAQGREPPGGLARSLDVMQRNGMRLLDLINQLLDLAKIDAGKMQIARNPSDIVELARNVETRFAAAATDRKISLRTQASGQIAPIAIDSAWIENALTNLLGNAMRFAESKVTINLREDDGAVVLEVEDDGPGIAQADLPTVFDRFAQGSDVQARTGGTGLGLAIVREAARLHGGDASVRSVPGVATTFTLTLPRAMAANAAGQSIRPPELAPHAQLQAPEPSRAAERISSPKVRTADRLDWPGPDPTAPLVVVCEDDDDLRAFTSEVLAAHYRVRAARNGEEGLALIAEVRPDAVISDVVMPKMDGYELCKALRRRDDSRSLPVILLTARRDVGRVLEGFDAGADDYVTKPFQARELLARVNVHVRLRRIVSEMAHRERLASLGVLAASLAHQVRNPLNAILAGLPAMRRKLATAIDRRDDDMFAAMIDSGERINTLIKDLMDLSRVDQEVVSRFKPADGVRSCMRLIEARIQGSVSMDADLDDAVEIEGKAGDMNHVFLNVIDNAVRASEPTGQIHIAIARRGNGMVFEVGDSGSGVASDKHEAVFAPFYTTRAAGEGTGLGLAIARQVVIQHGGTITISTSPLGGALFTVWLPSALATSGALAPAQTLH